MTGPRDWTQLTARELEERFWVWRADPHARALNTLRQDLVVYLSHWQHWVGRAVCRAVWNSVLAQQDRDIAQGGRPAPPLEVTKVLAGIRAYD